MESDEVWVKVYHPDPGLTMPMRMMTLAQALDIIDFYRHGGRYIISVHANEHGHKGGLLIRQLCKRERTSDVEVTRTPG